MTTTIETGALNTALRTLKLSGMLETIEARLAQARAGELGHIDFLQVLCEDEITRRASTSARRPIERLRAGFEIQSSTSERALARVSAVSAARRWRSQPKPSSETSQSSEGGSSSKIERPWQVTILPANTKRPA